MLINQASPCPYCGHIGYHVWAGGGGCPGAVSDATPIVDDAEMLRAYAETIRLKDAEIKRLEARIQWLEVVLRDLRKGAG